MVTQTSLAHDVQHWHTVARDRDPEPKGYRYVERKEWRQNRLKEHIYCKQHKSPSANRIKEPQTKVMVN